MSLKLSQFNKNLKDTKINVVFLDQIGGSKINNNEKEKYINDNDNIISDNDNINNDANNNSDNNVNSVEENVINTFSDNKKDNEESDNNNDNDNKKTIEELENQNNSNNNFESVNDLNKAIIYNNNQDKNNPNVFNNKIKIFDDDAEVVIEVVKKETELYTNEEEKASMIQKYLSDYNLKKQKNPKIIKNIEKEISFFFNLKDEYSDEFGNLHNYHNINYKPIKHHFLQNKFANTWINMVTNDIKKIYIDGDENNLDDYFENVKKIDQNNLDEYIFKRDGVCKSSHGLGTKLNANDIYEKLPNLLKEFRPYENDSSINSYQIDNIEENFFTYRNCFNKNCVNYINDYLKESQNNYYIRPVDSTLYTYSDDEKKIGDKTKIQLITSNKEELVEGEKINVVGFLLNPELFYLNKKLDDKNSKLKDFFSKEYKLLSEKIKNTTNFLQKKNDDNIVIYNIDSNNDLEIGEKYFLFENNEFKECILIDFNDDLITIQSEDITKFLPRNSIRITKDKKSIINDFNLNKTVIILFNDENKIEKQEFSNILEKIIPTFNDIFSINYDKFDKIQSIDDINNIIYPYNLHFNDLHFEDINIINDILQKNCNKLELESNNDDFHKHNQFVIDSASINSISDTLLGELEFYYGKYPYYNTNFDSDSKRLKWLESYQDNGYYYRLHIAKKNIDKNLDFLKNIDDLKIKIKKEKKVIKENICIENILAKIYFSLDDLKSDNNKTVNYDLQFDQTLLYLKDFVEKTLNDDEKSNNIAIAKEKIKEGLEKTKKNYKKNKKNTKKYVKIKNNNNNSNTINDILFKNSLDYELKKLNFNGDIEDEIKNIMNGGKQVVNNNFALLKENDEIKLFRRLDDKWVEINDLELLINVVKSSKFFCKFKNETLDSINLDKLTNKCVSDDTQPNTFYTKQNMQLDEESARSLDFGKNIHSKEILKCIPIKEAIEKKERIYKEKIDNILYKLDNFSLNIFDSLISRLIKKNNLYIEQTKYNQTFKDFIIKDLKNKKNIVDKSKLSFDNVLNYCREFGDPKMMYLLQEFDEFDTFSAILQTSLGNSNENDIIDKIQEIQKDSYFKIIKKFLKTINLDFNNILLIQIVDDLRKNENNLQTAIEYYEKLNKQVTKDKKNGNPWSEKNLKEMQNISILLFTISRIFIELQIGVNKKLANKIFNCKIDGIRPCYSVEKDELIPLLNLDKESRNKNIFEMDYEFPCIEYLICILINIAKNENKLKKKDSVSEYYLCLNTMLKKKSDSDIYFGKIFKNYINDWLQLPKIKDRLKQNEKILLIKDEIPKIDEDFWIGFKPNISDNYSSDEINLYLDSLKNKTKQELIKDINNEDETENFLENDSFLYKFNLVNNRFSINKKNNKIKTNYFSVFPPEELYHKTNIYISLGDDKVKKDILSNYINKYYCYSGIKIGVKHIFNNDGLCINCFVNKKDIDTNINNEQIKKIFRNNRIYNSFEKDISKKKENFEKIKIYLQKINQANLLHRNLNNSIKELLAKFKNDESNNETFISEKFDELILQYKNDQITKLLQLNFDKMFENNSNFDYIDELPSDDNTYYAIQLINNINYLIILFAKSIYPNNTSFSKLLKLLNLGDQYKDLQGKIKNTLKIKFIVDDQQKQKKYLDILLNLCSIINPSVNFTKIFDKIEDYESEIGSDTESESESENDNDNDNETNNDNEIENESDDESKTQLKSDYEINLFNIKFDNNDLFNNKIYVKFAKFIVSLIISFLQSNMEKIDFDKLYENFFNSIKETNDIFNVSDEDILLEIARVDREERKRNFKKEDLMSDDDKNLYKTKKNLNLIEFKSEVNELNSEENEEYVMGGGEDDDVPENLI